jgi:hypothetical protein
VYRETEATPLPTAPQSIQPLLHPRHQPLQDLSIPAHDNLPLPDRVLQPLQAKAPLGDLARRLRLALFQGVDIGADRRGAGVDRLQAAESLEDEREERGELLDAGQEGVERGDLRALFRVEEEVGEAFLGFGGGGGGGGG